MYYCEICNNVLWEREHIYVDMLFKQGVDCGDKLPPSEGGFHDLKVPAHLPVPLTGTQKLQFNCVKEFKLSFGNHSFPWLVTLSEKRLFIASLHFIMIIVLFLFGEQSLGLTLSLRVALAKASC